MLEYIHLRRGQHRCRSPYGLDERTVASWRNRAGNQCEQVHHAVVEQGKLDLVHVQVDETRVKRWKMIAWMGLVRGNQEPHQGKHEAPCSEKARYGLVPMAYSSYSCLLGDR